MIFPYKIKILRPFLKALYGSRSKRICEIILPWLEKEKNIIDIGCGTCVISDIVRKKDCFVFPLDIKNISLVEQIRPTIYDGKKIPAKDGQYDVSLIITVLHHTRVPQDLIREAARVSKKIIIVEDVYWWKIKKYIDFGLDGLINFEIFNQPHTNKRDSEWKKVFGEFGLELTDCKFQRSHFGFCHAFYLLEKK